MNKKILFVDDEPQILEGYKRVLRKDFEIHLAEGGEKGLEELAKTGDFAVIISDMRMPGMDGVQFLSRAAEISPDSIRIMLTGDAGQHTAAAAVNEGRIFQFLTKPCPPETLAATINAGLVQYRLVTAEKVLLEETLGKSLQVLVDILAIINPTAFSRSARIKRTAVEIATRLGLKNIWELEIAAMLSQIGCISVPEEILAKIAECQPIKAEELKLYSQHAQVAYDLISKIPRMETIAAIIAHQNTRISNESALDLGVPLPEVAIISTRILKVILDFDMLLEFGNHPHDAFREISEREGWYDPLILSVLKEMIAENAGQYMTETLKISEVRIGMVTDGKVVTKSGQMVVEPGQEITLSMIMMLINFAEAGVIDGQIQVRVPLRRSPESAFPFLTAAS